MRGIDGRLHLLKSESLSLSHIVETAGRSVHLYPIRSGRDDLPHRVNDGIGSIGHDADRRRWRSTASDSDSKAGDEHAGADHLTHVYQIAHRQICPVRRVEISNRRHARLERPLRVFLRKKCRDCRMPELRAGRGRTVPVVRDMGVRIDQAWNAGVSGKIDDLGLLRYRRIATCDASHPLVIHNDHSVGEDLSCAIDQFSEFDGLGCSDRRRRCGEEE